MSAKWRRRLQFRSGPQSLVFHACDEHRIDLETGAAGNGCFFGDPRDFIEAVDPADEIACDQCREDGADEIH